MGRTQHPESASVRLQVTRGPHAGLAVEVNRHTSILAGRARKAHLRLNKDLHFSRYHFRVEINPPRCYLLDLGSNNGTLVNGKETTGSFVTDGDVISGGKTEIRVDVVNAGSSGGAPATGSIQPAEALSSGARWSQQRDGTPTPDVATPVQIAGYQVLKMLRRAPLGVVYRARHQATGKEVALTLIQPTQSTSPERIKRFLKKARILGALNHSGIVRYIEIGTERPFLYVVTENVPAVPIERILRKSSLSSRIRVCCGIGCRVLEALNYAHTMSLVHRDIQPANLLLFGHKKKLDVKLADFGLARIYEDAGLAEIAADGHIRGSLSCMAPEQIINSRSAKPSYDLYSLASTLYQFLTGRHPYGKARGVSLLLRKLKTSPIPIRDLCPEVPQALADVLDRALARDPAQRWSSAREMYNSLFLFSKRGFVR